MIVLVEGSLGAGKTFYALKLMDEALGRGKPVATNVELSDDALQRAARAHPLRRWSRRLVARRAESLALTVLVEPTDLSKLMKVRLHGTGESRGIMVLDESHNWMNARDWTAKDRQQLIRFFSQSRKLGWDIYIISQRVEMIDKQVRNLAEYTVTLKNLRKFKKFGLGLPFNLFVAIWRWNSHTDRTIIRRDSYPLSRRIAGMYDTMATSHGLTLDGDDDAVWLPAAPEREPDARSAPVAPGPDATHLAPIAPEALAAAPAAAPCLTTRERSHPGDV